MARPLSTEEITRQVEDLEDWRLEADELVAEFEFDDFVGSLAFVNQVGEIAEELNHHPDIDIRWNKVKLALTDHAAGGISQKDVEAAHQISSLAP
ncbi:MAG: 4a-hydroxytetrahydrobiopterin dehydratase [Propionibacteriaceae bacterium]